MTVMVIFLLLSVPLGAVAAGLLLADRVSPGDPPSADLRYLLVRYALLPGIFLFVAMFLVRMAVQWGISYHYTPAGLFLYHLIMDYALWTVLATAGAWVVVRRVPDTACRDRYLLYLGFFATVFFLAGATEVILHDGFWTVYPLVVLPLFRLGIVLVMPLVLALGLGREGDLRLWAVPLVYLPAVTLAAVLFEWLRPLLALVVVFLVLALTGGVLYGLFFRDAFRRG